MRPISFETGYLQSPAGSCLASFGDTKVICTASIQNSVPSFLEGRGTGWVTAEYAMLPGSTSTRKRRELGKRDGRSVEIQRLIGRSLRAAIDMKALGAVSILIDCDVLQADGGTRTTAISGAWVALYEALKKLAEMQGTSGPEHYLIGQLAAVSVGIVDDEIVCDLDYAHDSKAQVDMNIVMMADAFVEIQGTGEQGTFTGDQMDQLVASARIGIGQIYNAQREVLGID
jgi:ribonuclease PH